MPPSSTNLKQSDEVLDVLPVLNGWVRGALVGLALGWVAVFGVALWLNPYEPDGTPRRLQTHTQLGLEPCAFYLLTKKPCPACGMTTSFALLMRGDLLNSLHANAVGTGLAFFGLVMLPWSLASVYYGRTLFVRSVEKVFITVFITFLGLMMLRWALVLWLTWGDPASSGAG